MLVLRLTRTPCGLLQPDAAESVVSALRCGPLVSSPACDQQAHVFGWSLDIDVDRTMSAFSRTRIPELVVAGRDKRSLGRWMARFGWRESRVHRGHFDFLSGHKTILSRIDSAYGRDMILDNCDVQRAVNRLCGSDLDVDGVLDLRWDELTSSVDRRLGTGDRGSYSVAFRRALALASVEIVEVASD